MTRIVHSADMHFDAPFIGFSPEKAEICRNERFLSFERTIDKVIEYNADILLLAGDVFENEYVSYRTVEFLRRCFARIQSTYVFIAPGNHDCISGNDIYTGAALGENVFVFSSQLSSLEIKEKNVRVYGYGFENRFTNGEILEGFHVEDDGMANIMVMHCSLPPYTETNPITASQIAASGLDYLAAGHIHAGGEIKKAGATAYAYSGVPQGVFFDETGKKGIIAGEVEKGRTQLEFIVTSKREVCTVETDVSECLTYEDVTAKLSDLNAENIYKITLTGKTAKGVSFNREILKNMLEKNLFFVKISDETTAASVREPGLLEKLFEEKVRQAGKSTEITESALRLGLRALGGEKLS